MSKRITVDTGKGQGETTPQREPLAWRDPNTPIRRSYSKNGPPNGTGLGSSLKRSTTSRAFPPSRRDSFAPSTMRSSRHGSQGDDWRQKRPKFTESTLEPVFDDDEETGGPATPLTPDDPSRTPGRTVLSHYELKPGTIIRGQMYAEYTPSKYQTPEKQSDHYFDTRWGKAYGEERHMVIVNCFQDHFVALPVFTHHGKGTANKKDPREYVTLHDHRHTKEANAQSPHKPLRTTYMDGGIFLFRRKSVVHITAPMCKNLNHPVVLEGYLAPESTGELIELYLSYCPPKTQERCRRGSIAPTPATPSSRKFKYGTPTTPMSAVGMSAMGMSVPNENSRWPGEFPGARSRRPTIHSPNTPVGSFNQLNLR
ncbi:hypothetical protein FQN54_001634 [Arachnomyces sp. PD_36]|nr:hypothetical protein FQN54_001634 [Arachnomyces sp. PD_36]